MLVIGQTPAQSTIMRLKNMLDTEARLAQNGAALSLSRSGSGQTIRSDRTAVLYIMYNDEKAALS